MINKIDALISEIEDVCDEFDYISDAEPNWHVACRISFYREHVERGIDGLREMRQYLAQLNNEQSL